MRAYKDRKNAQKKQYYDDRFYVVPKVERQGVEGGVFEPEVKILQDNGVEILKSFVELEQLVVIIDASQNFKTIEILKAFGYEQLSELAAVDFIADRGGYEVFYQLLSISKNKRARIKCFVAKGEVLKSVSEIYELKNIFIIFLYEKIHLIIPKDADSAKMIGLVAKNANKHILRLENFEFKSLK